MTMTAGSPIPTEQVIRVLLIEDNPADVDLIKEALEDADSSLAIDAPQVRAGAGAHLADGLARLRAPGADAATIDVVLLDLSLPDSQGFDTFVRLERAAPGTPIVVLERPRRRGDGRARRPRGRPGLPGQGPGRGKTLTRSIRYAIERKHAEDERARLASARAEAEAVAPGPRRDPGRRSRTTCGRR